MSGVAIYMEGGGDTAETKAALRQGMGEFLKELRDQARSKNWRWNLVPCGSRDEAKKQFMNARQLRPEMHAFLLVDAEASLSKSALKHVVERDQWNLNGVVEGDVHLMVQVMETWLVADPEMLAAFYGQHFHEASLPKHQHLESVSKSDVAAGLQKATKDTKAGPYHKIRHARHLLERVRSDRVRPRCPNCDRVFTTISPLIV